MNGGIAVADVGERQPARVSPRPVTVVSPRPATEARERPACAVAERPARAVSKRPATLAGDRPVTRASGQLITVRCRRAGASATLEAELRDGRDVIRLVWMGRRRIAGIERGAAVTAEGRLTVHRGRRTIFNPRYQLGTHPG